MVRQKQQELQPLTVPPFFRCPISMDVMKSPVSLCTGVTYDRSSIQAWLDTGHNTCPATMQILPSTDFVPNLTLRRLIHRWSHPSDVTSTHLTANQLIHKLANNKSGGGVQSLHLLQQIADFAKFSDENCDFLASHDGFVRAIVTAFAKTEEIVESEIILSILDLLVSEPKVPLHIHKSIISDEILARFVSILRSGSLDSRIKSARILELVAVDSESKRRIGEDGRLLEHLFALACLNTVSRQANAAQAGLSCLATVSVSRVVQKKLVCLGVVRMCREILTRAETVPSTVEEALCLLDKVCGCVEGRAAIGGDAILVSEVVRRLLKVSKPATEHGVTVVWSVCYLSRDVAATEAAVAANGLTKALLVMQSDCSAGARKMCAELVKVFRVNSKSCLASYDTQTTHIMPY